MKIVLISTYELGRQPFGLASPAAWLRADGHQVTCADLACGPLPGLPVGEADLLAFYSRRHIAKFDTANITYPDAPEMLEILHSGVFVEPIVAHTFKPGPTISSSRAVRCQAG